MGYSQTQEADILRMLVLKAPDSDKRMAACIRYFEVWYYIQRNT